MSSRRSELQQTARQSAVGGLGEGAELLEAQVGGGSQRYQAPPSQPARHERGDESVAYWQGQAQDYEHRATVYRRALDNLRNK